MPTQVPEPSSASQAATSLPGSSAASHGLSSLHVWSPDLIHAVRSDGSFAYANPSWHRALGYSEVELGGLKLDDIVAPGFRDSCQRRLARALLGEDPGFFEVELVSKAGHKLMCEAYFGRGTLSSGDGPLLGFGVFRKVAAEVSHAASLLKATLEATADGLAVVDRDGRLRVANTKFFQMWRISESADLGGHWFAPIIEQLSEPEVFLSKLRELVAAPDIQTLDILKLKDGRVFERFSRPQWVEGQVTGRVWSFRDATERTHQLHVLAERERLLSESQRIGGIGSWGVDVKVGKALWTGESYRLYGVPRDFEPNGPAVARLVYPDDLPEYQRHDAQIRAGHSDVAEFRIRLPDGATRILQSRGASVFDAETGVTRLVGTVQDVTHLRKMETEIRRAQKMEAIGRLAGGVAHDFNNLLTVILATVQLTLDARPDNDPLREDWLAAQQAGERAADLTHQLLAFSRRQVLQPQVLDLNTVVANMMGMLQRLVGEAIRLNFKAAPAPSTVKADRAQIEQVIVNLVSNARDATPRGGELTIEIGQVAFGLQDPSLDFSVQPGTFVVLSVIDTGVGMDQETRGKLFEPFFTTKPSGKGTGLGLPTVDGIVRQSGGMVQVESRLGRGSTFKVCLPRVEGALPETPELRISSAPQGQETIFVVEDESGVRRLVVRSLSAAGYIVHSAASGDEAIQMLEASTEQIHLLLTDVIMPGMSARELAARAVAGRPDLRVLFMSGYSDDAIAHQGVLDPAVHLLSKPFSVAELKRTVRALLDVTPVGLSEA